jgi:hypothetical protein
LISNSNSGKFPKIPIPKLQNQQRSEQNVQVSDTTEVE